MFSMPRDQLRPLGFLVSLRFSFLQCSRCSMAGAKRPAVDHDLRSFALRDRREAPDSHT